MFQFIVPARDRSSRSRELSLTTNKKKKKKKKKKKLVIVVEEIKYINATLNDIHTSIYS